MAEVEAWMVTKPIGKGPCCRCKVPLRRFRDGYCKPCRAEVQRERRKAASNALEALEESHLRIAELETAVKILRDRIRLLERLQGG